MEVLRQGQVKRIRPRYEALVNRWWMCDTGRFAFEGATLSGRLEGAQLRGYSGLEDCSTSEALAAVATGFAVHTNHVFIASPWLTVEEGRDLVELAQAVGAVLRMVSPEESGLADKILNTGDPCPNRRGLADVGIESASAPECLQLCTGAETATLVGERVVNLVGREALSEHDGKSRLFVFDTQALDAARVAVQVGVASWVERSGTWVNADGHESPIAAARSAPAGVCGTQGLLDDLRALVATCAPGSVSR